MVEAVCDGIDDPQLRVEQIPEAAIFLDGIDGDQRFIAVAFNLKIELVVVLPPHRFSHQLSPELRVVLPFQPFGGPPILDV